VPGGASVATKWPSPLSPSSCWRSSSPSSPRRIALFDPYHGDYAATWQLPSGKHWLGTDDLGRDVLSRLIYGSRVSLAIGILSQIVLVVVGVPIGALAGLLGGRFD